jgi:hypothetical protein
MALSKPVEQLTKSIREYKDSTGKVTERWHYDLNKFRNGPILVENLDLPPKEKVAKKKKLS